jgi:hypothetical protein
MAEVKFVGLYRVDIIESERGWGQKIDDTKYFETLAEAQEFTSSYNATHNTQSTVPDWYMYAESPTLVR